MSVDTSGRAIFHPWVDTAPERPCPSAAFGSVAFDERRALSSPSDISEALDRAWQSAGPSTVCIQAGKGVGKSKQIRQFCAALGAGVSVLSVTFRRSLARGVATQLGGGSKTYMDGDLPRVLAPSCARRLTILVNSIWRVAEDAAYDVLVLDEAVSIMEMAGSDLLGEPRRAECCQRLHGLVARCKLFIFADAMFDHFSVAALWRLRPAAPSLLLIAESPMRATSTFVWYASEMRMCEILSGRVAGGRKVACACMTKAMAVKLADMVAGAFPSARVMLYTANGEHDMSDHMTRIDAVWSRADVLIFSPVITAGCSFERDHFDDMFLFGFCGTAGVRAAIQMTARVRSVRSRTVHVLIDKYASKSVAFVETSFLQTLRARWDFISAQEPSAMYLYDCVRFSAAKERAERDALFFEMFWAYVRRSGCATRSEFGATGTQPAAFAAPVAATARIVNECMWGFSDASPRAARQELVSRALDAAERISLPPENTRPRDVASRPWKHVQLGTLQRLGICGEAARADAARAPADVRDALAVDAAEAWQAWSAAVSVLACSAIIQCSPPEACARMYADAPQLHEIPSVWWDARNVGSAIRWACDSFAGWAPDSPMGEAALADACDCAERLCAAALALDVVRDERNKIRLLCRAMQEDGPSYLFCELLVEGPAGATAVCFDASDAASPSEYDPAVCIVRAILAAHLCGCDITSLICLRARSQEAIRVDTASRVRSEKIRAALRSPRTNTIVAIAHSFSPIESEQDLAAFLDAPDNRIGIGWGIAPLAATAAASARGKVLEDPRLLAPGADSFGAWAPAKDELRRAGAGLVEWRRLAVASGGVWTAGGDYMPVAPEHMRVRPSAAAASAAAEEQMRRMEQEEEERLDAPFASAAASDAAW
jgi:hypothetical protein